MRTIIAKYFIPKGSHKATDRNISFWTFNKEIEIEFEIESGWYRKDELNNKEGVSKIKGFSMGIHAEKPFGKIPIIKQLVNSMLIGCKAAPEDNVWEIWVRGDSKGKEFQYKVGHLQEGRKAKAIFILRKGYVNFLLFLPTMTTNHRFEMNTIPFGYLLGSYFGGHSVAVRNFVTYTKTILK